MADLKAIDDYLDQQRQRFVDELCEFLRIPSVSARSEHRSDVERAGRWVHDRLEGLGLKTGWITGLGHPIVVAETPPVEGAPVVLVYGHYDVQPTEPNHEWITPPFEPTIRDGNVYARGATDDKGQMLTHLLSTEAWLKTAGKLPLQLKFVIEGEEEVGSAALYKYLEQAADRLQCDVVVISDSCQFAPGIPRSRMV